MFSLKFIRANVLYSIPAKLLTTALLLSAGSAYAVDCTSLTYDQLNPGYTSTPITCECYGHSYGTIWGDFTYTTDSPICLAAAHAGKRGFFDSGGSIPVYPSGGGSQYRGKWRYGIFTYTYNQEWKGFTFESDLSSLTQTSAAQETVIDNSITSLESATGQGSVTFFAGGDPQFMFNPAGTDESKTTAAINAERAMRHVSTLANKCTVPGKKCSPAFVIAGDLMMDWNQAYLSDSKESYERAIDKIGANTPYTVVFDGLGNHDSAYSGNRPFFNYPDYGFTGNSSKYAAWRVFHRSQTKSCWNNALTGAGGGFDSALAFYCKDGALYYYTVEVNNYNGGNKAYIIQLHGFGDTYSDDRGLAYLNSVKGLLDPAIPVIIVSHFLPIYTPSELDKLNAITSTMNVAAMVVGHEHLTPNGSGWTNLINYSNGAKLKNTHGNYIQMFNASALLARTFITVSISGNKVKAMQFDVAQGSAIATQEVTYKP